MRRIVIVGWRIQRSSAREAPIAIPSGCAGRGLVNGLGGDRRRDRPGRRIGLRGSRLGVPPAPACCGTCEGCDRDRVDPVRDQPRHEAVPEVVAGDRRWPSGFRPALSPALVIARDVPVAERYPVGSIVSLVPAIDWRAWTTSWSTVQSSTGSSSAGCSTARPEGHHSARSPVIPRTRPARPLAAVPYPAQLLSFLGLRRAHLPGLSFRPLTMLRTGALPATTLLDVHAATSEGVDPSPPARDVE
jgi:hypothetical protein